MKKLLPFGLLALTILGCGEDKKPTMQAVKVETMSFKPIAIGNARVFSGTVEESENALLSFNVSGTVDKVYVTTGQIVQKGQLIATIDDATLRNAHDIAKAALMQAEDAYTRLKQLRDSNSLPEIQWTEVVSKVKQARASEEIARKALADSRIYAPFSGMVAEKGVGIGENAVTGMTVVKLVNIDKVKVKVMIPENEIALVDTGQEMRISVMALNGKTFEGTIAEKGIVANPLSRSYEVKAIIDNPQLALKPGMICDAVIKGIGATAGIVVPANLVQLDNSNSHFVWLAEQGKAKKRYVAIGDYCEDGVIITKGLRGDELIITKGQQKVSEGSVIKQ